MTLRAITAGELIKLRGERQYSELFAIPRIPNVIYTARLNGLPPTDEDFPTDMILELPYNNGSGTLASVLTDMTMLVGSTAGARDLGICRIRDTPTSNTFCIGEESHIDWVDGCYLTIVDDYDILPRHLKIVNGVFLIDGDISYSDQYEDFEPVVNIGGHRVVEWDGISATVTGKDTGSWVFDSTISSRLWSAPGSSSISGETTTTPTITYTAKGHYVIYCRVTAANGKTYRGARYVFVVDPSELAPIHTLKVSESLEGSSFEITMTEGATLDDFIERAFVIVASRDYYNGIQESIGYNTGEENISACGRIINEGITFNDEAKTVSIQVANWQYWLAKIPCFPCGLEMARNTPSKWTDMPKLNVDRAIFHLLRYRSTVLRICDFFRSNDTRYAEELASVNGDLWSQIEEIAATSIFAYLIFDRFGSGYLRVEGQLVPVEDRSSWVNVQEITKSDIRGEVQIELNQYTEVAQILSSGVYIPLHGSSSPRFSMSPGHIPYPYGEPGEVEKLLLGSQSQSNKLSGMMMGWENRRFDNVRVEFVGNNRMLSVAQYCRTSIQITSDMNARGISYDGYLSLRDIEYNYEVESGFYSTIAKFEDESTEFLNITGDPPNGSGVEPPPPTPPPPIPPIPPFPPPPIPPPITNSSHPKYVICASSDYGFVWTDKFNESGDDVIWQLMNEGLDELEYNFCPNLVVTPSGAIYALVDGDTSTGWSRIVRAEALGGIWSSVFEATTYDANARITGLGVNPTENDEIAFVVGVAYVAFGTLDTHRIYTGGGSSFSQGGFVRLKYDRFYKPIVMWDGKWVVFGHRPSGIGGSSADTRFWVYDSGGSIVSDVDGIVWGAGPGATVGDIHASPASDKILVWGGNTLGYTIVTGLEVGQSTTITDQIALTGSGSQAAALAPTGQVGFAQSGVLYTPYKTEDGAATFASVADAIPVGSRHWENCGDDNRFIFGSGATIRFLDESTGLYFDKMGNQLYITPLININAIRFAGDE